MTARRFLLAVGVSLVAACGDGKDPKTKTEYVDTYLDVTIAPDETCDPLAPVCVSALETNVTYGGERISSVCYDLIPLLGQPAQTIQELGNLAGTGIADALPASGLIGIELRAYSKECAGLAGGTQLVQVFAGYAEIELAPEEQQLPVPVSCEQPQLSCDGVPTPGFGR